MKRRLAIMAIMGLAVFLAACGDGKGKTKDTEDSSAESVVSETADSSETSAGDSSAAGNELSGSTESGIEQDNSISTENVPTNVVSDFEEAAAAVEKLTGGNFKEEEVCYETYSYSDEYGSFKWDSKGLDISLSANPSTGYFWTLEQFGEKNTFTVTNDEYVEGEAESGGEPLVGVGGTQKYYLSEETRGADAFVLDYSRQNSDGTRDPGVVYLLCAHADEGDEITFSIRKYTVTEQ